MLAPGHLFGCTVRYRSEDKIGSINIFRTKDVDEGFIDDHVLNKKSSNLLHFLDKNTLEGLEKVWKESSYALSYSAFVTVLRKYISESEIERIYKTIDISKKGCVEWSEFTTFLIIHAEENSSMSVSSTLHELMSEHQQVNNRTIIHHDMIQAICCSDRPYSVVITGDRKGEIKIWKQSNLNLLSTISHQDKSSLFLQQLNATTSAEERACMRKSTTRKEPSLKTAMISGFVVIPSSGHIIVGSVDLAITIYEISKREIYGRITNLTDIPSAMTFFSHNRLLTRKISSNTNQLGTSSTQSNTNTIPSDDSKLKSENTQFLGFGDSAGNVHVIEFDTDGGDIKMAKDSFTREKNLKIFERSLTSSMFTIRQVHKNWITQTLYIEYVHALITSSQDGYINFIDLEKRLVTRSFTSHRFNKDGTTNANCAVRCFVWFNAGKYMCSAASDRRILVWDPFTLETISVLGGHSSHILQLFINESARQLVVITVNKDIYTWDLNSYQLISTISDDCEQQPEDCISASCWAPSTNRLFIAGNRISSYKFEQKLKVLNAVNDGEDLHSVLFSTSLRQVVTISLFGTVQVFDADDGAFVFKFASAAPSQSTSGLQSGTHTRIRDSESGSKTATLTLTRLDESERRLIVVTVTNYVQIWNFNNGQLLTSVLPKLPVAVLQGGLATLPYKITCVHYEAVNSSAAFTEGQEKNRTNQSSNLTNPSTGSQQQGLLTFGTSTSFCCALEEDSVLLEDPVVCLLRPGALQSECCSVLWIERLRKNMLLVGYSDGMMALFDLSSGHLISQLKTDDLHDIGLLYNRSNLSRINRVGLGLSSEEPVVECGPETVNKSDQLTMIHTNSTVSPRLETESFVSTKSCTESAADSTAQQSSTTEPVRRSSINFHKKSLIEKNRGKSPSRPSTTKPTFSRPKRSSDKVNKQSSNSITTTIRESIKNQQTKMDVAGHVDRTPPASATVIVRLVVFLQELDFVIGACTDQLFRFWDMERGRDGQGIGRLLCRLPYAPEVSKDANDTNNNSGEITSIHISRRDLLIGSFDNGIIRIWLVNTRTLTNLRLTNVSESIPTTYEGKTNDVVTNSNGPTPTAHQSHGTTLNVRTTSEPISMTPLRLLRTWDAHQSAILSAVLVNTLTPGERDGSSDLIEGRREQLQEGRYWVLSASHDQKVRLWSPRGSLVGTVGEDIWALGDKSSWVGCSSKVQIESGSSKAPRVAVKCASHVEQSSLPPPDTLATPCINKTIEKDSVVMSNDVTTTVTYKSKTAPSGYDYDSSKIDELNNYVSSLRTRRRVPQSTRSEADRLSRLMENHPVVDPTFVESAAAKLLSESYKLIQPELIPDYQRKGKESPRNFIRKYVSRE